ncbi:MAG: hypothetical protein J6T60_02790 [Bacteroidales bacterium]|nr:hypothetical protein [Bacteroidales bacterium]MBP5683401.1 hypothetical protein [Bacteroidales bacterium]
MTENFENKVVNDVTTKKKYVSPKIEVFELDEHAPLLAGSSKWGDGPTSGGELDD